jgi:tetratricopeptide (TPR) repeat protein
MGVQRAREAAARGEWEEAYDVLVKAAPEGLAGPADLRLLGEVAYAAGHLDVAIESWERAHALGVQAGDPVAAADAAVRVAMHLLLDTALMAPVRGWLGRAERLLEGQEEQAAHAWLAVVRSYERMLTGDVRQARHWSERAIEIGARRDAAACAVGRVAAARLRILGGDVEEGLALLDEAGVAAVSGDLDPLSTGLVYCEVVCALQGLAQYDVAEEWTQAMERWCRTNAIGSLHGRCRVHRAEILRLRGACDEAERQALVACEELRPYLRRELGWPLSELGLIRLRKGDIDGAEEALLAAHRLGWEPQPGLALVRLAQGDAAAAVASIRDALDRPLRAPSKELPPDSDLQRAPLLDAQVEIEIAHGELDRARAAAGELERVAARFQSPALLAGARLARGRVRLAEGRAAEAEGCCSEAVRLWNEIGAPYEAALARMVLADALRAAGSENRAALELQAARTILARIEVAATPTTETNVFRREGDYWSVVFDGHTVRVRDLKGMRYLAQLLTHPGREFHVLDLVAAETGQQMELGDAGEMLDERAKAAYRRRLAEI